MKRNRAILAFFKASFSALLLYLIFTKVPFNVVAITIGNANPYILALALFCNLSSLAFSALRSKLYFSYYGLRLKIKDAMSIYYIGSMFNAILPSGIGGDGYKIFLLSKLYNFSKLKSLRTILYERANGLYPLCVLSLLILFYTPFYEINTFSKYIINICAILVTPFYFLGARYILMDKTEIALKALPLSFIVQLLQVCSAVFAIYALDANVGYYDLKSYVAIFLISSIFAILPISIGGVGIREFCFLEGSKLIYMTDVDKSVSIAVTIFMITIFTAIISIPIWIKYTSSINANKS